MASCWQVVDNVVAADRFVWPNGNDPQASSAPSNLRPVKEENLQTFENKQMMMTWPDQGADQMSKSAAPVVVTSTSANANTSVVNSKIESVDFGQVDRGRQERVVERSQVVHNQFQPAQQYTHPYSAQANPNLVDYDKGKNVMPTGQRNESGQDLKPGQNHQQGSNFAPQSQATPTYRVNQMEPLPRPAFGGSQSVRSASGQAAPPNAPPQSGQTQTTYPNRAANRNDQPLLPYNNRAPPLHGLSKSGASTPAVVT